MRSLAELVTHLDTLLDAGSYQDYCPNGLQVEGRGEVRRLITGVSASAALIDAAIERGADALLVHHGWFWKGEAPSVVGIKRRRLARLLGAEMSLIAYHLPLDGHPQLGNNARLGELLGATVEGRFGAGPGGGIAMHGTLPEAQSPQVLAARLAAGLGREPLHIAGDGRAIRRLAWCSGAAQGYLEAAASLGVDAYISGEISEPTVHIARETGVHYFAAGHHATERAGVRALGEQLSEQFGLEVEFVDIDNPV